MSGTGDKHNFGRSVLVGDEKVFKPRCLVWEYLFLSSTSGFRKILAELFKGHDLTLPDLEFEIDWESPNLQGTVEKLVVTTDNRISEHSYSIGITLGILCYFGVADLHIENLVVGRDSNGKFVFTPIDIETLLTDSILLSSLTILPKDDEKFYGLSVIEKVAENCPSSLRRIREGYEEALRILSDNYALFLVYFNDDMFKNCPVRVMPRCTQEYFDILNGKSVRTNRAEDSQLARGDIPYFFKKISSNTIYFYDHAFNEVIVGGDDLKIWADEGIDLTAYFNMHSVSPRQRKLLKFSPLELEKHFKEKLGEVTSA